MQSRKTRMPGKCKRPESEAGSSVLIAVVVAPQSASKAKQPHKHDAVEQARLHVRFSLRFSGSRIHQMRRFRAGLCDPVLRSACGKKTLANCIKSATPYKGTLLDTEITSQFETTVQ